MEIKNNKGLKKEINILDAITTPGELIRETLINFMWGFLGNSIVVFVAKELDFLVLINYIAYYILISYIVLRAYIIRIIVLRLSVDLMLRNPEHSVGVSGLVGATKSTKEPMF